MESAKIIKTYNYKNHLIWKFDNKKYIVEELKGEFTTLQQCKNRINLSVVA